MQRIRKSGKLTKKSGAASAEKQLLQQDCKIIRSGKSLQKTKNYQVLQLIEINRSHLVYLLTVLLSLIILLSACTFNHRSGRVKSYDQQPLISLYMHESGEVEQMPIEVYIQGVVAAEMDTSWPLEALAAQAILARTFTMENIARGRMQDVHGTDASTDTEEFQAYDASRINENVKKAVAATRGQVISWNGKYIHAWFSADNGGISASAAEGLDYYDEETPYVRVGVEDSGHEYGSSENKNWQAIFDLEDVRQAIAEKNEQETGDIISAEILQTGPSGRATRLKIGEAELSGPALRLALGSEIFRSTLLTQLEVKDNCLYVSGNGFGHGVGMSQWGARRLAEQGAAAAAIIEHYFQDIEIITVWS